MVTDRTKPVLFNPKKQQQRGRHTEQSLSESVGLSRASQENCCNNAHIESHYICRLRFFTRKKTQRISILAKFGIAA